MSVEDTPATGHPVPPPEEPRRYPSTIGGALYLVALLGVGVGLVVVTIGDWRVGIRVTAVSLGFAALCRLLLPGQHAGMLAVRHRFVDALLLSGLGAALFFLAGSIPNQPL